MRAILRGVLETWLPLGSPQRKWLRWGRHQLVRLSYWLTGDRRWRYDLRRIPELPIDDSDRDAWNRLLARFGFPALAVDRAAVEADHWGAARAVLAAWLDRPDLRPLGLSHALGERLADEWRVSERGRANLRAVFDRPPGHRVELLYDVEYEVRKAFPLALTPAGRTPFLAWLFQTSAGAWKPGPALRGEEVAWFALAWMADPGQGVEASYRRNPIWQQAVPDALTPAGWPRLLAWLGRRYRARFAPEDLSPQPPPRSGEGESEESRHFSPLRFGEGLGEGSSVLGVNVVGHFRYPSGLCAAATHTADALRRAGVPLSLRDMPVGLQTDLPGRSAYLGLEEHPVTVLHVAAQTLPDRLYPRVGWWHRTDRYRVGVWYWELETVPRRWRKFQRFVDEVWAPTRFIADALGGVMTCPVVPMLPGVELPAFPSLPRGHFGLPDDRFLFLFMFDMRSFMDRKNPLGLIEAYRKAFRRDDRTALVIKVLRGSENPEGMARLTEAADEAGVTVIDRMFTHAETYALMAAADCYASLHRSEGFGLTLAESMLLGKPVIATEYSGNLDFCTADNSLLVRAGRVSLQSAYDGLPRGGAVWADPDTEHAAELMRHVFTDRDAARALGERARRETSALLSLDAYGARLRRRLEELSAGRG